MDAKTSSIVRIRFLVDSHIGIPFLHTDSDVLEFKKIVDNLIEKTEQYSKQVEAVRLKVKSNDYCSHAIFVAILGHRCEEYVEIRC